MTAIIFLILLLTVLSAGLGHRKMAMVGLTLVFILTIIWFKHHVTDSLNLPL